MTAAVSPVTVTRTRTGKFKLGCVLRGRPGRRPEWRGGELRQCRTSGLLVPSCHVMFCRSRLSGGATVTVYSLEVARKLEDLEWAQAARRQRGAARSSVTAKRGVGGGPLAAPAVGGGGGRGAEGRRSGTVADCHST